VFCVAVYLSVCLSFVIFDLLCAVGLVAWNKRFYSILFYSITLRASTGAKQGIAFSRVCPHVCLRPHSIWKQASHELWNSAGSKMPIHAHLFRRATLARKVSQAASVFGARSGFNSKSVHARLQVCLCCGYDLCYPG